MEPSFEYTQYNHFRWGWEKANGDIDWFGSPDNESKYHIKIGRITREVQGFRQECVNAVKAMAATTNKPIVVGLSGGSDSQLACISLMEAQIPFEVVISRYTIGAMSVNLHDISVAYEFCKKYNIRYNEITLDIDQFYRTRAIELARRYNMAKLQTITQTVAMDWANEHGFYYIMAGGDPVFYPLLPTRAAKLNIAMMTDHCSVPCWIESPVPIMQYMIDRKYEGCSKFYLYSPELHASYLMDPVTTSFLAHKKIIYENFIEWFPHPSMWWKLFQNLFKPMLTCKHFPEIIPAKKFTGFEGISRDQQIPSQLNVYKTLLSNSIKDLYDTQEIVIPIEEIVPYLNRPEADESRTLVAQK